MMRLMIEWARAEGLRVIAGEVLRENVAMLEVCRRLGFDIRPEPDDPEIQIVSLDVAMAVTTRESAQSDANQAVTPRRAFCPLQARRCASGHKAAHRSA